MLSRRFVNVVLSMHVIVSGIACGYSLRGQTPQLARHEQPYKLQPSDQVQLTYRYTPEYDESLTVQPDGAISLKLIGSVKVGGLSLAEAQALITHELSARLNAPEVTLLLTDFVRPSYVITGQVTAPGKFELRGQISAIDAIAIAGGFKDSAKSSQVILYRRINGTDYRKMRVLDLKQFANPKRTDVESNEELEAGDLLIIPKSNVAKINDYVHWISVGTYLPLF